MYESFLAKADFVNTKTELPYTVLIGIAAVFAVLVLIIIMCKVIGVLCRNKKSVAKTSKAQNVSAASTVAAPAQTIENRQKIIAAVSAAVAEELGTDVSAIRIKSFKKL